MLKDMDKRKRVWIAVAGLVVIAWLCRDDDPSWDGYGPPGGSRDAFHSNHLLGTASNFDAQGSGYIHLGDGQSVTLGF